MQYYTLHAMVTGLEYFMCRLDVLPPDVLHDCFCSIIGMNQNEEPGGNTISKGSTVLLYM